MTSRSILENESCDLIQPRGIRGREVEVDVGLPPLEKQYSWFCGFKPICDPSTVCGGANFSIGIKPQELLPHCLVQTQPPVASETKFIWKLPVLLGVIDADPAILSELTAERTRSPRPLFATV